MFIAKFCLLFPFYTFRLFLCYKNKVIPCNSVPTATHIKKKNPKKLQTKFSSMGAGNNEELEHGLS